MRCWFALLQPLGPLIASAHSSVSFQQYASRPPSRALRRRGGRSNGDANASSSSASAATALSATRERRTNYDSIAMAIDDDGAPESSSPGESSAQEEQLRRLVDAEEAARSKRAGQAKRREERLARMENRLSYLEGLASDEEASAASAATASSSPSLSGGDVATPPSKSLLSDAERKELEGLRRTSVSFEEQYDPAAFSESHAEFKRIHNGAFVALAKYCGRDRRKKRAAVRDGDGDGDSDKDEGEEEEVEYPEVFYLDGPDGATSSALMEAGFDPSRCYVANRHLATCLALRERLPEANVAHRTAAEALSPRKEEPGSSSTRYDDEDDADLDPDFSDVDFAAYYFDGCGGFVPHVVGMMTAALIRPNDDGEGEPSSPLTERRRRRRRRRRTTAVGFSLLGGNRDVVEKEMAVCRALAVIARTRGMRTRHVLDDPGRYGVSNDVLKTEGGTFTSWMLLEEDD